MSRYIGTRKPGARIPKKPVKRNALVVAKANAAKKRVAALRRARRVA
ncbi:MAG: hypothetical protein GX950_02485 [Candidatus Diapherotrites archaeon]|jgi:hypothetical protein|uniref:Uncharacterized protein n=1 Tax=Candidatus Iainarchaeum sp. TaxID=3101447 RepID=A0A7K4BZF9_9ARCH|nr:hypothetical protein [Candidatus Diapherotrites archaeon]